MAGVIELKKGDRFGRWTVLGRSETTPLSKSYGAYWICKCDCGQVRLIQGRDLRRKHTRSCGCSRLDQARERGLKSRKHRDADALSSGAYCRYRDKKETEALTNGYIAHQLSKSTCLLGADIPVELIKLKREQMKLSRLIKQKEN